MEKFNKLIERYYQIEKELTNDDLNNKDSPNFSGDENSKIMDDESYYKLIDEIHLTFDELINISNSNNYYFKFCSFNVYKNTFESRLGEYKKKYQDSTIKEFIESEINTRGAQNIFLPKYITSQQTQNTIYSNKRIIEFLENYETLAVSTKFKGRLKWKGSQSELIELLKALIESKKIDGTQKEIFESFETFFDFTLNNPNQVLQNFKSRNKKEETLFLDNLKTSLLNWINKD